jgi:hypothetical protein
MYVDDILLIGDDIPMMEAIVKYSLRKSFLMKNLGEPVYILDIKIYRDRSKKHGITLSKKHCLSAPDEQERMRVIPYASAIGSIM